MLNYGVFEISGKQYKMEPGKVIEVTLKNGELKDTKALLVAENGKVQIGKPYLKENPKLKILEQVLGKKIRVAKFHAKANYRKVRGFRAKLTKIVLEA